MLNLPMKAMCINGTNEKIKLTINEVFGFPNRTDIDGGYGVKGNIDILVGCYTVHSEGFFFSTGSLYRLYTQLEPCYQQLRGTAVYRKMYEDDDLSFAIEFTKNGHVVVMGQFKALPHVDNELKFEMETDQTQILETLKDLKEVIKVFGDNMGKPLI